MFTTQLHDIGNVRIGADGQPQTRSNGQLHKAADRYITADPDRLREKLEESGWATRIKPLRRIRIAEYGNRIVIVEAAPPRDINLSENGDAYNRTVSFLCDHQGKQAFRILPTVWREACMNEFQAAPISVNHMNPELYDILKDPAKYAYLALEIAEQTLAKIGELRGRPYGNNFLAFAREYRPRIGKRIERICTSSYGEDMWSAAQAYTNSRSPWAIEKVQDGLANHFAELYEGEVPQAWIQAEERRLESIKRRKVDKTQD